MMALYRARYQIRKYIRFLILFFWGCAFLSVPAFANNDEEVLSGEGMRFGRLVDGQYTLTTSVNGVGPLVFMVDTGASRTSIFESTRRRLGIEKHATVRKNVSGMTRSEIRPVVHLDSLKFAGQEITNHVAIVLDDWYGPVESKDLVDGILGMDVLAGLVLSFEHETDKRRNVDHKTGKISILKSGHLRARKYRRWTKIKLIANPYPDAEFGLIFTNTLIGGLHIPTLFDTGASFTAISWDIVESTKLGKEKRRLREEWVVQGAVGEFKPRIRVILKELVIGGVALKKHELLVMNFDNLPLSHYGKYPLVITGVDFLGEHDFVLDLDHGRLVLDVKPKKRPNTHFDSIGVFPSSRLPL
ncbi:MAG: hypothetical protein COA69_01480 [Robiginitomaculum sp.]|nr:MAG: hypothetical protein COA69_01480 [Robiginitomaculum sp.]